MRTIFLVIMTFCTHIVFGQSIIETRTASLVDGDYSLDGTVHLELFDDNSLNLRFESNYLTQSNVFDVHVFLTNNSNYTSPIDTSGSLLVANIGTVSGLNYSSGPMTFSLPSGTGINDYQNIVFVCIQYGRLHWGHGVFGSSVITTNVSSLETNHSIGVTTYPNPSSNGLVEVQFQTPQQSALIEVLDINGRTLSSERVFNVQQHLMELKESGLYFIRLTMDNGSTIKKVIRL